ncbi:unnamed protein product [Strongylus vulgaris]|uniref:Copper transport protein n=1 Tax=Strongylus vulgaris TaxID=40348 RepID=A0A3P7J7C6_STRVU|nr:unnamed protein product [Strongylus vulgaris]
MASPDNVLADVDTFLQELANSTVKPSEHLSMSHRHGPHEQHMHGNHVGMQHGMGMGMHDGHMMKMWFHGGYNEVILFDFWRIGSISGLVISFIAIFVMGAMYEGIKWFRVYLQMSNSTASSCSQRENGISLQHVVYDKAPLQNDIARSTSNEDVYNPTTTPPSHAIRSHNRRSSPYTSSSPCSSVRLTQAALYVAQLVLAYWLMLIVMTYNTWLNDRLTTACSLGDVELVCNQLFLNSLAHRFAAIAVILGAGFGHWLFAVLKFRDLAGETADSFATDACH